MAFTFALVLLLSLSRDFMFTATVDVYLLVVLSSMDAEDILSILKTTLLMTLFTFMALLPSSFYGGSRYSIMIISKVFGTVAAVNILSHTTGRSAITAALKSFFIPGIFILVFGITIKYIAMLRDFTLNVLYALKLRPVGRDGNKYASICGAAGRRGRSRLHASFR